MPRKRDKTTKLPAPHGLYARPPTPGQVIQVLILEPYKMTVEQLSERLGYNEKDPEVRWAVNGKGRVFVGLALRLSKLTGTSPNIWLDLQRDVDLWDMRNFDGVEEGLDKIEPFPAPLRLRKLITPTTEEIDSVRP